jgi:uncharacterized protein YoxC
MKKRNAKQVAIQRAEDALDDLEALVSEINDVADSLSALEPTERITAATRVISDKASTVSQLVGLARALKNLRAEILEEAEDLLSSAYLY